MSLSSHVLDGARGTPARGVRVRWDQFRSGSWQPVTEAVTDDDGRVTEWADRETATGIHRLVFDSGEYFRREERATFYPEVVVVFEVVDAGDHHHVPLLLSPFAYSTYRGS